MRAIGSPERMVVKEGREGPREIFPCGADEARWLWLVTLDQMR
jgi:hypothetical protein